MKLKKLILSMTLIAFLASSLTAYSAQVSNAQIKQAINKYKTKNYIGCLQDTEDIIRKDPSNAFAYYYQALAYTQLGKTDEAIDAYNKVISLNNVAVLVDNAGKGIKCLEGKEGCKPEGAEETDLDKFIKSDKFYGNSVQADLNKKKLDKIKNNINKQTNLKSEMPTNDEIAEAVKTLAKIGFNPLNGMNSYQNMNPEMLQMNMLLGNNSNPQMNMLPMLLMSSQNGNKISPEVIQTMLMNNMSSDLNYGGMSTY